jgi:alkanesulfonate monooxygenase SsuD/methylene tetrahydromethanopterin reductase-like flavin-dependent oxidoreductase (luciferase family)
MNVGIFDLLERGDAPLADLYERRLELVERYDRAGFYSYHLAEHHSTPHGLAPSPSVFLSAVAQRTERLRFGPLVALLPYYHPLRFLEEVCMLDQLSRGRLDLGFGRGISPIERRIYGIPADDSDRIYDETYRILRTGLTSATLDFAGEFSTFENVPLSVRPYQKPHPPLWYGTSSLKSVDWVAHEGVNLVTSQGTTFARDQAARYWELRNPSAADSQPATVGILRKIVVAETDEEAHALAVRVYPQWLADFNFHQTRAGIPIRPSADRPPTWDEFVIDGKGVAGAPDTVAAALSKQLGGTSFNYFIAEFFWGPMKNAEVERSIDLFARDVMPLLQSDERTVRA